MSLLQYKENSFKQLVYTDLGLLESCACGEDNQTRTN